MRVLVIFYLMIVFHVVYKVISAPPLISLVLLLKALRFDTHPKYVWTFELLPHRSQANLINVPLAKCHTITTPILTHLTE